MVDLPLPLPSGRHPSGTTRSRGKRCAESRATLLVFTLGARRESRRRRLLPPEQGALEDGLHQACLDAVMAAGRAAGLRLQVSSPLDLALPADVERMPQRGTGFGTRLESALGRSFARRGAERDDPVVLVGSDVPDLQAHHLRRTLEILEARPDCVVIGPSPDGGFYLLASSRPLGAALSQVRWRCRQTLRSLKRSLSRQGRTVVLLPPLIDLDRRADLERWLAGAGWRGAWRGLVRRLAAVLADLRRLQRSESGRAPARSELRVHRLRGPPLPA